MTEPLAFEVDLPLPPDEVWPWLRERRLVTRWHGWSYEGFSEEVEQIYFSRVVEQGNRVLELEGGDRFELSERPGGSRLRMVRAPKSGNPEWDEHYDDISQGWQMFTQQLAFALTHHPDDERRTLFLATDATASHTAEELVGLMPTTLGEQWYTAERQTGRVLPDLGPGLAVAALQPSDQLMATVSVYGLDDTAFEELRTAWTGWWAGLYPDADPPAV